MDTFKIVATKEKRGVYFTAVPHRWEKNKILFWPEHMCKSQREILRSNAASAPETKWARYPCILKVQNIVQFQEALDFEKKLENCADTDAEEEMFAKFQKSAHYVDRNHLFTEVMDNDTYNEELNKPKNLMPSTTLSSELQDVTVSNEVITIDEVLTTNDSEGPQIVYELKSTTEENYVLQELSVIKDEIKEMKNVVISLRTEFDGLKNELKNDYKKASVLFEEICKKLDNLTVNDNFPQKVPSVMAVEEDHLKKFSFPLQTVTEINELDDEIRNNEAFKNQMVEFLSRVGGCSGQNDATKVAYKISDMLFSSEILTHYSWTGISKRKENLEKQSFTALKKIIEVFFVVLSKSDDRHTKEKNEKIIKDGILKHAKKRNERKRLQTGTKKDLITAENELQNKLLEGNNEWEQAEDNNQPIDKDSDSEIIN